ncbi:peroxiredoxin [Haloplanus rubicundus]|uniref:thioredoxin-dependent peroxiredoxin n=1 Tax=Haloplanus rubicundus TaxID=1547898 RepID=A0A345E2J1_9EURY|nr:peroxiredoxin [Haloplanus rubicundus]AXG06413.1 peroxiredoxin [Haloplanus rubicundus]AXG09832.1 peroxiredoxin [Haloplanus rubicundus]
MLQATDEAPEVTAADHDGETVTLSFAEPTVLYFYPRDDTPGCTVEAEGFDAELAAYRDAGVAVYGVSTDDVESHAAFRAKYDLDIDLLADPDGEVATAFGVAVEGGTADRVTYVLADGEVKRVYRGVDPDGHARDVLQDLVDDGVVAGE